jgi:hypothetical protein
VASVGDNIRYYSEDFFDLDWNDDAPFYGISHDSLMLKTVRVNVVKSKDSSFHVYTVRFSRSNSNARAKELAENIKFTVNQKDSVLELPKGFAITRDDKFRNQQVLLVVEVPVGKKIELDESLDDYEWFTVNTSRRKGFNVSWDNNWDDSYHWDNNVEYVMTREGLQRTDSPFDKELKDGKFKLKIDENGVIIEGEGELKNRNEDYEYKAPEKKESKDTVVVKAEIRATTKSENVHEAGSALLDKLPQINKIRCVSEAEVSPLLVLSTFLR